MLTRFTNIIVSHRHLLLLVVLVLTFWTLGDTAYAQTTPAAPAESIATASRWTNPHLLIYDAAIGIGGMIVFAGGSLLDGAMQWFVLDMGEWMSGNVGVAVDNIWTIVRDILNMFFIFGLIYIGLKIIWDSDDSGARNTLGLLILAALLINFSLLIAKVIVDFSNIAAVQIYNVALSGLTSGAYSVTVGSSGFQSTGVVGAFMELMALQTYAVPASLDNIVGVIGYSIVVMLFMIITGMVFAMGALMLTARFIALVLFMMFSPVMFLGWIFPKFQSYASDWWQKFLRYCFFAPVYLFMLYISLYTLHLMQTSGMMPSGTTVAGALSAEGVTTDGQWTLMVYIVLAIGFMIASIIVSQKIGVAGANVSMNFLKGARSRAQVFAGGATAGMAARLGRNTVGRVGQAAADSDTLLDAASKKGISGSLARATLRGSRFIGDSSFDARQVGDVGKNLGIGEGKKGGYKTRREEIEKQEKAFAKSLGEVGDGDTQVKTYDKEVSALESKIKALRLSKEGAVGDAAKAAEQRRINETEDQLKTARENLAREKNRRQIGSAAAENAVLESNTKLESKKAEIKALNSQFKEEGVTDERKKEIAKAIIEAEKEIKTLKKEARAKNKDAGGYASTLESSNWWGSWVLGAGRSIDQDRSAGEAIRKQYDKEIKKTKEEKNSSAVVDAIKESTKKDG